ncbi:hypothetical protein GCT13_43310 [Paraburkholderia sp. CNPSo 3157]|uniref:Uncharacterized protein n=1 Tax=Paraburkholderia franconis TaxID=2654983 RepID=A0A7X1TLF5_9BURK|nr:hypothetical protein [Paraburkholderia franconis]
MTARGKMSDKAERDRQAQQNEEERTVPTDVSGSSDEGTTVRGVRVWEDDLSQIAHKPDD